MYYKFRTLTKCACLYIEREKKKKQGEMTQMNFC